MSKPENNEQNFSLCVCVNCPTYSDCGRLAGERLFCSRGKGVCVYKPNGCICPGCPVYKSNKLKYNYYCRRDING